MSRTFLDRDYLGVIHPLFIPPLRRYARVCPRVGRAVHTIHAVLLTARGILGLGIWRQAAAKPWGPDGETVFTIHQLIITHCCGRSDEPKGLGVGVSASSTDRGLLTRCAYLLCSPPNGRVPRCFCNLLHSRLRSLCPEPSPLTSSAPRRSY